MKQEDKELLLKDLTARLPYGVKCKHKFSDYKEVLNGIKCENAICYFIDCEPCLIEDIKPYLFPLSSMTEEQKKEFDQLLELELKAINDEINHTQATAFEVDFYYKHHLDWRGLIPMDLAIDCTNLNIY